MKKVSVVAVAFLLALAGCKHPTEVELRPEELAVNEFDVESLVTKDTTAYQDDLDSTAVTPQDKRRFRGFVLVNRTTFDAGGVPASTVFSKILLQDTTRPVEAGGEYWGFDFHGNSPLALLTINGAPMYSVPHYVRVREALNAYGVEFRRDFLGAARFDSTYTWRFTGPLGIKGFELSIQAPPAIGVQSPAAGSVIPRNRDLPLRWTGTGNMTIYVSVLKPAASASPGSRLSRPILKITPQGNARNVVISTKLLQTLPANRRYVFTFVLSNRQEETLNLPIWSGSILVQAAAVYNTYVELR